MVIKKNERKIRVKGENEITGLVLGRDGAQLSCLIVLLFYYSHYVRLNEFESKWE